MVMFKARFRPLAAGALLQAQQRQQQQQGQPRRLQQQQLQSQPVPPHPEPPPPARPQVPPIEEERGPQHPIREPGPAHEPERVLAALSRG